MRMLRKSPGFTAIAVGSLALGIGANTAIFTVAQHMLLDRLDVPHPEQLRMFYLTDPRTASSRKCGGGGTTCRVVDTTDVVPYPV